MSDGESKAMFCTNPNCVAKHIGMFSRLVGRDGLNIVGLADSKLEILVDHGFLKKRSDIFHLDQYKDMIISMDGFGAKSCDNLLTACEKAKQTTFRQFFYCLGIPGAGHDAAKILEMYFSKNHIPGTDTKSKKLCKILESDSCNSWLSSMDGIGDVTADSISDWYDKNKADFYELLNELTITDDKVNKSSPTENRLEGKVFVIIGKLNHFVNRDALVADIESKGGKVSGSVSKKTDYLINNDTTSASGKNKKAKELGIPVLSEEEFLNL